MREQGLRFVLIAVATTCPSISVAQERSSGAWGVLEKLAGTTWESSETQTVTRYSWNAPGETLTYESATSDAVYTTEYRLAVDGRSVEWLSAGQVFRTLLTADTLSIVTPDGVTARVCRLTKDRATTICERLLKAGGGERYTLGKITPARFRLKFSEAANAMAAKRSRQQALLAGAKASWGLFGEDAYIGEDGQLWWKNKDFRASVTMGGRSAQMVAARRWERDNDGQMRMKEAWLEVGGASGGVWDWRLDPVTRTLTRGEAGRFETKLHVNPDGSISGRYRTAAGDDAAEVVGTSDSFSVTAYDLRGDGSKKVRFIQRLDTAAFGTYSAEYEAGQRRRAARKASSGGGLLGALTTLAGAANTVLSQGSAAPPSNAFQPSTPEEWAARLGTAPPRNAAGFPRQPTPPAQLNRSIPASPTPRPEPSNQGRAETTQPDEDPLRYHVCGALASSEKGLMYRAIATTRVQSGADVYARFKEEIRQRYGAGVTFGEGSCFDFDTADEAEQRLSSRESYDSKLRSIRFDFSY